MSYEYAAWSEQIKVAMNLWLFGMSESFARYCAEYDYTEGYKLSLYEEQTLRKISNYIDSNGNIIWPPNDGFDSTPNNITLEPGTRLDRYGNNSGNFVAPQGTPYSQRSLFPTSEHLSYKVFEVVKPINNVLSGRAVPWFNEIGGGIQYKLPLSIQELIDSGYIIIVYEGIS